MKKGNTEILAQIANENGDIVLSTTLVGAEMKGKNGFVTIGTTPQVAQELAMNPDRYINLLFRVDEKRYFELADQDSEFEKIKAMAEKWEKLSEAIAPYYDEEDERYNDEMGLLSIGEITANHLGYL